MNKIAIIKIEDKEVNGKVTTIYSFKGFKHLKETSNANTPKIT